MKNPRLYGRGNSDHPHVTARMYEGTFGGRVRATNPETSWGVAPIAHGRLSDLRIASECRLSRRTVIRAIHRLAELELVEVHHRRDAAGDSTANDYTLPLHRMQLVPVGNPDRPP